MCSKFLIRTFSVGLISLQFLVFEDALAAPPSLVIVRQGTSVIPAQVRLRGLDNPDCRICRSQNGGLSCEDRNKAAQAACPDIRHFVSPLCESAKQELDSCSRRACGRFCNP